MLICGFEKFSMVDYPKKIACTVFTYGCNFRCPFCHNAGLVAMPANGAVDEADVFDYLRERRKLLDGVVVSGGEPTLQPDLAAFIEKVKRLGLLVKLDTNGANPFALKNLLDAKLLDYVAMDIKSGQSGYSAAAGVSADMNAVRRSVDLLRNGTVDYEFRTTLVDELHAQEDVREIGSLIGGAKRYYLQRFEDNGTCILSGMHPVPKEKAEAFLALVRENIPAAELRNY